MVLLDGVLVLVLGLSALGGWRTGLVVRATGWVGLLAGLLLSPLTVPPVLDLVAPASRTARLLLVAAVFTLTLAVTALVADLVGRRLRRAAAERGLTRVDQAGGVLAGMLGIAVVVWVLAPVVAAVPGAAARQVRGSVLVGLVQDVAPPAPNPLASLQAGLASTRFPEVFADLAPAPPVGPPPTDVRVPAGALDAVAPSTVKVEVSGCGAAFTGSGWTLAPGVVATNAHVVAGATAVQVLRPDGSRRDALVVALDERRDVALLEVEDHTDVPALPIGVPDAGEDAAVLGHPNGSDQLRVSAATVGRLLQATGRDIYGEARTERTVLVLAAELARGSSGSPVVDAEGLVVGMVFAISPDDPDTAYALAPEEVLAVADQPREPGETGRCP